MATKAVTQLRDLKQGARFRMPGSRREYSYQGPFAGDLPFGANPGDVQICGVEDHRMGFEPGTSKVRPS